jgi:hypothetical protein
MAVSDSGNSLRLLSVAPLLYGRYRRRKEPLLGPETVYSFVVSGRGIYTGPLSTAVSDSGNSLLSISANIRPLSTAETTFPLAI